LKSFRAVSIWNLFWRNMMRDGFATRRAVMGADAAFVLAGETRAAGPVTAPSDQRKTKMQSEASMDETRYAGIRFRRQTVNGVGVHFIEAGDRSAPTLLLLHGFPSTSRMWDRLIPSLLPHFHVIAPDYPGFGLSDTPPPDAFVYSFDNLANVMRALLRQIGVERYSLIMQDYGGPIGFRMALAEPERLGVIVAQNLAAYDEALGPLWEARKAFWADPRPNHDRLQKNLLSLDAARVRHIGSSPRLELYDPNSWQDEYVMLSRPGMGEIHTTLFYDYRNNVTAYPKWQAWLRATRPPLLVTWGRYDLSFMLDGAKGFARDNPNTDMHILNASHFPMDEAPDEVRALTLAFLRERLT
jgi:pimeloyl-ACP methyl ester carboxylesterase